MLKLTAAILAAFFLSGCGVKIVSLEDQEAAKRERIAEIEKQVGLAKVDFACGEAFKSGALDFPVKWRDSKQTKRQAAGMAAYWKELCKADPQQANTKTDNNSEPKLAKSGEAQ